MRSRVLVVISLFFLISSFFYLLKSNQEEKNSHSMTGESESGVVEEENSVEIFLVAGEKKENEGKCKNKLVSIVREVDSDSSLLVAYEMLFLEKEKEISPDRLYNSLYQSSIDVESVELNDGVAEVRLRGEIVMDGVCDPVWMKEQLLSTALQFEEIKNVEIYINNAPIEDALSKVQDE